MTDLELWLRTRENVRADYAGSFIAHYAERWVYLEIPGGWLLAGTACVTAVSFWIYLKIQDTAERQD